MSQHPQAVLEAITSDAGLYVAESHLMLLVRL